MSQIIGRARSRHFISLGLLTVFIRCNPCNTRNRCWSGQVRSGQTWGHISRALVHVFRVFIDTLSGPLDFQLKPLMIFVGVIMLGMCRRTLAQQLLQPNKRARGGKRRRKADGPPSKVCGAWSVDMRTIPSLCYVICLGGWNRMALHRGASVGSRRALYYNT